MGYWEYNTVINLPDEMVKFHRNPDFFMGSERNKMSGSILNWGNIPLWFSSSAIANDDGCVIQGNMFYNNNDFTCGTADLHLDGLTFFGADFTKSKPEFTEAELAKANKFLEETIGKKNMDILKSGGRIGIKATSGWLYGMKSDGSIMKQKDSKLKIFKNSEVINGQLQSSTLPMDDLLASFYMWAKFKPDELEERWLCGNITIEDKTEGRHQPKFDTVEEGQS